MTEIKISELTEVTANEITDATLFIIARDENTYSVTWEVLKGVING